MKRSILHLLSLSLLLSLCACAADSSPDNAIQTTATPVPMVDIAPDAAPMQEEASVDDTYVLEELMAEVPRIQAGSSGCSLRAVSCAAKFMAWGSSTTMTEEEIYNATAVYMSALSPEEAASYLEQLKLLDSTYLQLLAPGQEELLETAGCADSGYPWSSEPIAAMEYFMIASTVRQTSQLSLSSANMEGLYADYLFYSHRVLLEGEAAAAPLPVNYTALMEYRAMDGLHTLGYCLYDINLDGLDELILASIENPTLVYDIVGFVDGQVTPFFQGWSRNFAQVSTDGTITVYGSGGAAYSSYTFYTLGNGQLLPSARILYDGMSSPDAPWFYTTDADDDVSNDAPISEEQAHAYIQQHESLAISFDLSPFAVMGLHP